MSADNSNNSTTNSQSRLAEAGSKDRGARAAERILRESGATRAEPAGKSGQSRRPFARDRDNDPSGKNLPLDKAAEMLGFGTNEGEQRKSSRSDRSKSRDDVGKRGNEATRAAPDASADDARANANRPALELDDDDLDPAERKAKKSKSRTVSDFAEEMGVDAKALYELAVPFDDDDEPMTVGAMKDRIKEVRDFERRRDEHEDWRTESMNEVLSARQQIDGVMQRVMQTIPRETLENAFGDYIQQHQGRVAEARKQLREYFPEWNDASVAAKDREDLDTHLETYGFSKFEIDNLQDARLIRFAVHAMRLMGRYKRMKEEVTKYRDKIPTTAPTSRRAVRQDPSARADTLAKSGDKLGAIASLIGK
jgi:hypothetical protein